MIDKLGSSPDPALERILSNIHESAMGVQYTDATPTDVPDGKVVIKDDGTNKSLSVKTGEGNILTLAQVKAFVGSIVRALDGASGDVSTTGVGFTPKAVAFFSNVGGTIFASWGFSDGTHHHIVLANAGGYGSGSTQCIYISEDGGTTSQSAIVKSFDADGFTLTWTKVGSPASKNIVNKYIAIG